MDFDFTEEQVLARDTARKFAKEEVEPTIEQDEKEHKFRPERMEKMAELGFFGSVIKEEYGGTEFGHLAASVMAEEQAILSITD